MTNTWLPRWLGTFALACLLMAPHAPALAAPPAVGEVPPELYGRDHSGIPVNLAEHRGKVVIVTFWASWCGPCRKELPVLANLQRIIGKDALQVYAVNWGESKGNFNRLVRHPDWPQLDYVHDGLGRMAERYGIVAVPHMFIIDHDGKLVRVHRGYTAANVPDIVNDILALLPEEVRNRPPRDAVDG